MPTVTMTAAQRTRTVDVAEHARSRAAEAASPGRRSRADLNRLVYVRSPAARGTMEIGQKIQNGLKER